MFFPLSFAQILITVSVLLSLTIILLIFVIFQLRKISKGQKLSSVLTIKLKDDIVVKDFKANKERILNNMLATFEKGKSYYGKQDNPDPDTWSFFILDHSGFRFFIEDKAPIQKALTMLLANGDDKKIKNFLKTLVNNL